MVTLQDIERLHAIAGAVLRKHDANIDRALPEFMSIAAFAGLSTNTRTIPQFQPVLEYAAREYLEAFAKETPMTETKTKTRMMAELIFPHQRALSIASSELSRLGFEVRQLPDWVDEYGESVWALAFYDYDGDQDAFFNWIHHLTDELGGDVIEAGYAGSDADVEAWIAKKS